MSKNLLVISVDVRETRVALIEDGIIAELHIERRNNPFAGTVGNVYLGKVTRVLPGLQAAFIDIGQERAAFLHVEDLIRPDDFDAYLAGGRKHALQEGTPDEHTEDVVPPPEAAHAPQEGTNGAATVESGLRDSSPPIANLSAPDLKASDDSRASDLGGPVSAEDLGDAGDADEDDDEGPESGGPREETAPTLPELEEPLSEPPVLAASAAPAAGLDDFNLPGFTISNPGEPVPRAPAPPRAAQGDRGRGRGRGRGGREGGGGRDGGRGRGRDAGRSQVPSGGGGGGDRGRGGRGGRSGRNNDSTVPNRISKSTPIRDVVREGQEIIVQVTKDPIGTKGARCSSHISLPGRYVVYLPTVDHVGISKRIGSEKERARLREAIESMKPPSGGLIVRTVAEGLTKKQMKQDVGYLVRLWGEVAKKKEGAKAPAMLASELDLVLKVARDLFGDDVAQVVIDEKHQYDRLCRFVEMFAPERVKDIIFYQGEEPIFDAYGIEDEIQRALSRKVPLPSGGHLVIDQAEALTAIDVNTGRFVGKGSKDMEETILKTNLEAVHEIAYQLRFRNIGGLIILDLIDMERHSNREKVRKTLDEILQKDKAKTTLNRISDLGLIEMTRKRTRESLGRLLHEPCFYCDGTGHLQSKETIAYEILREIRRKRNDLPGYTVTINAHPAVADLLMGPEKAAVQDIENRFMRKITIVPRKDFHIEQFDLVGK